MERNSFSLSARAASYFLWPYLSSLSAPLSLPLPILLKSSLFLPAQRPHISFGTSHAAASQWEKRTERERGRGRRGRKRRSYHLQLRSLCVPPRHAGLTSSVAAMARLFLLAAPKLRLLSSMNRLLSAPRTGLSEVERIMHRLRRLALTP